MGETLAEASVKKKKKKKKTKGFFWGIGTLDKVMQGRAIAAATMHWTSSRRLCGSQFLFGHGQAGQPMHACEWPFESPPPIKQKGRIGKGFQEKLAGRSQDSKRILAQGSKDMNTFGAKFSYSFRGQPEKKQMQSTHYPARTL